MNNLFRAGASSNAVYAGKAWGLTGLAELGSANGSGKADGSENHVHDASCKYYEAGEWIEVPIDASYYNLYLPASVPQNYAQEVTFESTAR